jgi:2-oxoglutarate dehydrogenase E1 component
VAKSPSKPAKTPAKSAAVINAKPAAAPKAPKQPAVAKAASKATAPKPPKIVQPKTKAPVTNKTPSKLLLKETSQKISQIASDILADRIVPTVEQIKAIAASALGLDETKGKKLKGKKK